ncbi:MAG: HAD family phosphatase, partial [Spirochaetaceae bacterium]|nr:HAD family phosphatase [Spirochaetaceae bacterium]
MIRNIIFDLGNVLMDFQPMDYLNSKGLNQVEIDFLYREIFLSNEWVELDRGTITREEALKTFCIRNPEESELIRSHSDFENILTPLSDNVQILKELKDKGYKLYYLTNYHDDLFEYSFNKFEFFKIFDGGVVSAHVKLIKPDIRIFQKILDKYFLKTEETLFIDDLKANVHTA